MRKHLLNRQFPLLPPSFFTSFPHKVPHTPTSESRISISSGLLSQSLTELSGLEVAGLPVVLYQAGLLQRARRGMGQVGAPLLQLWVILTCVHWDPVKARVTQHPDK